MKQKKKVIVGLSGGVDSAVAALTLIESGYQVEGLFMKNWEEDDTNEYCSAKVDLEDVRKICHHLQIPLHTENFSSDYWKNVFSLFLDEYQAGRTPNPDILCNKEIKFNVFLDKAQRLGADYIATGHYVTKSEVDNLCSLHKGHDTSKDQSYFLYTLQQNQLKNSLFPIGHMNKTEVRVIAEKSGLCNFDKKDSTGICFIGERKFKDFLEGFLGTKTGDMVLPSGERIGKHDGLMYYTLGQRQGLRIGGRQGASDQPWYVVAKNIKDNQLVVAQGHNHPWQFSNKLIAQNIDWVTPPVKDQFECQAKVRYRQGDQKCNVTVIDSNKIIVRFQDYQRAVTPGQSVVLYDNNKVLGGGIINLTNSIGGLITQ